VNEMLKAYLDNELNAEERALVEKALAENPALQTELDELQALAEAIEMGATGSEVVGLETTLAAMGKKRKRLALLRSPYIAVAAMTCLIAFVMTIPNGMVASVTSKNMAFSDTQAEYTTASPAETATPATEVPADGFSKGYDADSNLREERTKSRAQGSGGAPSRDEFQSADPERERAKSDQGISGESYDMKAKPQTSPGISFANPRLIIKNGDIQVLVKNLESSYQSVETLAKTNGGFVESGGKSNTNQSKYGNLTIRVDSTKFDRTMQSLRTFGDVQSESNSGEDVTAVVADAEARLKQMRLEERQYQEVLKQAKKVSDILEVKRYISEIRQQIEGTEAQIKSMRGMATLSTIYVGLEERLKVTAAPRRDWLPNAWIRAINRFTGITRSLVSFTLNIVVLAPFWLPVMIGLWIWRKRAVKK